MLQVKEGDGTSCEVLLGKYRRPVVSYLNRMVQNQAIAEELAQEVFLRVYRARGSYEPTAKFTTWLFKIATHLALNSVRDRKHEKLHKSLSETVEDRQPLDVPDLRRNREQEMVAETRLQLVRDAISSLPEKQRAAVLMHKYQELDYAQIADALGCSVSAVKSLLFSQDFHFDPGTATVYTRAARIPRLSALNPAHHLRRQAPKPVRPLTDVDGAG